MLTFALPTGKRLVVSFWTFFQISRQPKRIRKNRDHQKFLLMQVILLVSLWIPYFFQIWLFCTCSTSLYFVQT